MKNYQIIKKFPLKFLKFLDFRKDNKKTTNMFPNRRSAFNNNNTNKYNNNNNLNNNFSNHDNTESHESAYTLPKISLNSNNTNRPLLNKFQSVTPNSKSTSNSNHILKTHPKSYPSSESSSGLGDSPNSKTVAFIMIYLCINLI